ncbi:MAG: shikimate kinase [Candidatus Shikimatogenerans sp. JK-2022]|nr:shikimate kinase [Candidatus Shikimatogenerans bostrichidophilus]
MKIILIGYMGSGKTYIGKILSSLTNLRFYDLDELIENYYKITINKIFFLYGEKFFRKIERQYLNYFLFKNYFNSYILSVGGGTPCFYDNINLMNFFCKTIYLNTDLYILHNRLLLDNNNRPIINNVVTNNLFKFIDLHIRKRNLFYNLSKYKIHTKNLHCLEIIDYIKKHLKLNANKK